MKEVKVTLFDTGYCLNFEKMVAANKPWRVVRFYSIVALIEHPDLGPLLFDTGYSSHVKEICCHFPYSIYKWVTPIKEISNAAEKIQQFGYQAKDIKHVILSHFHADHIGGLKDFPDALFHYLPMSYEAVKHLKGFQAVRRGFLPDLIPGKFEVRSRSITATIPIPYFPFDQGYDLFGDQSIIGIELPGHADGQLGILLKTSNGTVFFTADACWQSSNYKHLEFPSRIGRLALANYEEFCCTLKKLNTFHQSFPDIKIVPSHCLEILEKECTC